MESASVEIPVSAHRHFTPQAPYGMVPRGAHEAIERRPHYLCI
jgi:hypothetical protein